MEKIFVYNLTTFEIKEIEADRILPNGNAVKGSAVFPKWEKKLIDAENMVSSFLYKEIQKRKIRLKPLEDRYKELFNSIKESEKKEII